MIAPNPAYVAPPRSHARARERLDLRLRRVHASDLPPALKHVLIVLVTRSWGRERFRVSHAAVARDTSRARRHVVRIMRFLVNLGVVVVTQREDRRRSKPCEYRLDLGRLPAPTRRPPPSDMVSLPPGDMVSPFRQGGLRPPLLGSAGGSGADAATPASWLNACGVAPEKAADLIARFGPEACREQAQYVVGQNGSVRTKPGLLVYRLRRLDKQSGAGTKPQPAWRGRKGPEAEQSPDADEEAHREAARRRLAANGLDPDDKRSPLERIAAERAAAKRKRSTGGAS